MSVKGLEYHTARVKVLAAMMGLIVVASTATKERIARVTSRLQSGQFYPGSQSVDEVLDGYRCRPKGRGGGGGG